MKARSLYVHFPFCERKCHYCDFYSIGLDGPRALSTDAFEASLRLEAERSSALLDESLDTIFFGGGTPSLVSAESMRRALDPFWSRIAASGNIEWTMEANPSSLTKESLRGYRELGINRLSLGIQSLQPHLLETLGRVHSREKALLALEDVFSAGFSNVSVDLLCGVPGQTIEDLDRSLNELLRFPITHLSCYLLTLAPGNALYDSLPEEGEQLAQYLRLDEKMSQEGFEHYEISNFARPGHRARHNLNYWSGLSYLGLGPSAHSYDARHSLRWKNRSSLEAYWRALRDGNSAIEWQEKLTSEQLSLERWMLALRMAEGIPESWLDTPNRKNRAAEFERHGLLEQHPTLSGRKRLTAKGFALSDEIISALA